MAHKLPEPRSAWWIPIMLGVAWGPPEIVELLRHFSPTAKDPYWGVAFQVPWFFSVTLTCTGLAIASLVWQVIRMWQHLNTRSKGKLS
jgi:hypothetical protein